MTAIKQQHLIQSVADALQFISYYHPVDYIESLAEAYRLEQSPAAKDAIAQILTNSRMCAEGHRPICQDTGIVCAFVRVGMDVRWEGAPFTEVAALVTFKPEARVVMVHAEEDFTANVPLADLMRPTTLFALKHNGEPLPPEHGYPVRLVVPHLYAWKSVKWVRGIKFLAEDAPGFWEQNGYNMYGDPFREQRYSDR